MKLQPKEPDHLLSINYFLFIRKQLKKVRMEGLEPPHLAASDPKSDVSTNFTTCALRGGKSNGFF